ncbi:transposon Tf2-1 polyprotein isoform X1 [Cucumis melo var. makuwa]|uniref:Transposon Tf2-1 polyprotein isoform X1 n=1 Tax=Cucumis melo var. makuwa TaxID=1194695 RepID=A0A5A7T3A9_CUCMM|nr:transposon Tf2-1 polyprotein isoform X1 [Cucumis melo var. makuwa]
MWPVLGGGSSNFSKTLCIRDRARPVYKRELIAVVFAVQRWRPYLLERKFTVKTDQRSLKFLLEKRVIQPQNQRWIAKLLGYLFEVVYKPGLENKAANALSRIPPTVHLSQQTAPALLDVAIIREEVEKDPSLQEIIKLMEEQKLEIPYYTMQQGVLKFKGRLTKVGRLGSDLVSVDRLSKYAHFFTLKHPYTAKTVDEAFVKEVVKLHRPYSQVSLRRKRNEKLSPKYFGPYKILEKIEAVAYKLEQLSSLVIHPMFHASQLKKAPEEVYSYRKNQTTKEWEILVSWKCLPPHEATWEDCANFKHQFPEFHLVQDGFGGGE